MKPWKDKRWKKCNKGANTVVPQAKLQFATLALMSECWFKPRLLHFRPSFPANAPGKTADDGPSTWVGATQMDNQGCIPRCWLQPCSDLVSVATISEVNPHMEYLS